MTVLLKKTKILATFAALFTMAASASSFAAGDALELAWSAETGKAINIAPLRAKNIVVTVPLGGKAMIAFEAETGKEAWRYQPKNGVWNRGFSSDGKHVFVCEKGAKLSALKITDGSVSWRADLGVNCQRPQHHSHGVMYVSTTQVGPGLKDQPLTGAKIYAMDPDSGHTLWSLTTENYLLQTPYRVDDTVYTGGGFIDPESTVEEGGPIRFFSLDANTGKIKWTHANEDGTPKAIGATKDKMVYIGYQDFIVALDAKDGKKLWRRDTGNWTPSLVVKDDLVYSSSATRKVFAWNMKDGKTKWDYRIDGPAFDYLLIKPIFVDGRMYFMSNRGNVHAMDPKTGEVIWTHQTKLKSRVGIGVGGGFVYVGDENGRVSAFKILK